MQTNATTSSVNPTVLSSSDKPSLPFIRSVEYRYENMFQPVPVFVPIYGTHQNLYFDIDNIRGLCSPIFSRSMIEDINSLRLTASFYSPFNGFAQRPLCVHFDLITVLANRSYGDISTAADNIRKFIINFGTGESTQTVNPVASNVTGSVTATPTPESQSVKNVAPTSVQSINDLQSEEHRLKCELTDLESKSKIAEAMFNLCKIKMSSIEIDNNSSDEVVIPKNRMTDLANLISRDELKKRECDLAIHLNKLKGECTWKLTLELRDLNASIKSNTQQKIIAMAEYELAKTKVKLEHLPRELEEYQARQEYSRALYNIVICKQKLTIVQAKIAAITTIS